MAKGMAGTRWRRPLVPLIVMAAATLTWVKARRRPESGSMPRSWSQLDPSAPTSLGPVSEAPVPGPTPDPTPAPATVTEAPDEVPVGPVPGPYPGSVLPLDDGSPPSEEFVVKGNTGSMRSHSTSSPYFGRTRAEVWFRSQEDAVAAGFSPWTPKR